MILGCEPGVFYSKKEDMMSRKPVRKLGRGVYSMSWGKGCVWFLGALALVLLLWAIVSGPIMLHGLYERTVYEPVAALVPLTESRAVSYAEARENFKNQNPDTRLVPGDLDYVNGYWVAEVGPGGLLNMLIYPSQ